MPDAFPRRTLAVAAVAGAFAMAAGPAAYSVATAGHALNGNNVLAGPASAGGGAWAARAAAAWAGSGAAARSSSETLAYLEAHQGSAKYLVAATGSHDARPRSSSPPASRW